jgi:hypothetical protein
MSKPKVPPAPPGPQGAQAPRTIPLSDITITLPVARDFPGDPEGKTVTIGGAYLARMLVYLQRAGTCAQEAVPGGTIDEARMDLLGLGDVLLGLSTADLSGNAIDDPPVFRLLYKIASDLAARLSMIDDVETVLKEATVTIGAPAAEAK